MNRECNGTFFDVLGVQFYRCLGDGTVSAWPDALPVEPYQEGDEWYIDFTKDADGPECPTCHRMIGIAHVSDADEADEYEPSLPLSDLPDDNVRHRLRHMALHKLLDELAADYLINNPGNLLSDTSIMTLIGWSHKQTKEPDNADHTAVVMEEEDADA
jgi:hypothetical protein